MPIIKIRAALETALDSLVNIVPDVTISSSTSGNPCVVTTVDDHKLADGVYVTINGHTGSSPDLNGVYLIKVLDNKNLALYDSVTGESITSTSGGIDGNLKANLTAYENFPFSPVSTIPYQKVNLLAGKPSDITIGPGYRREIGLFQITLYYPVGQGAGDSSERAEYIRSNFKRGNAFTFSGVTVNIGNTPEIMHGTPVDENFVTVVRIPYWANIFN